MSEQSAADRLPEGWYLDQAQPGVARFFDGVEFTEHAHDAPDGYVDPAGWKLDGRRIVPATAEERELARAAVDGDDDDDDDDAGTSTGRVSLLDRFPELRKPKTMLLAVAAAVLLPLTAVALVAK